MVIQLNLDKQGHRDLGNVIATAEEHNADIVCLQEVENVVWATDTLSRLGWNYYTGTVGGKPSKVGMLIYRASAERAGIIVDDKGDSAHHIWHSKHHHSMGFSLVVPGGTMLVVSAYIPSGVDSMPDTCGVKRGPITS